MPNVYRAFTLNEFGRIDRPASVLPVASDQEAIDHAVQMIDGHDLAVWCGDRFVATVRHTDGAIDLETNGVR